MTGAVYSRHERRCDCCGEAFWGTARARYCGKGCRQRAHRAKQPYGLGATELAELCRQLADAKREDGASSPRKLLPRLFRAAAAELRKQGWDPIELLLSQPDEPVSDDDTAPGGIEGESGNRRMWLFPPEEELRRLEEQILERKLEGAGVGWYERRRDQLQRYLNERWGRQEGEG
jgi:hypothetical protein